MIECLTDNKNRTAAEVRLAVTKNGGSMADPGSVSYQFARKGIIVINGSNEDAILEATIEHDI
jgi:transcriptional/translational regulatory protein YebC/TACO1